MSSLLYYSISSDLTEDQLIEIDKQVVENREKVSLFITELPSFLKELPSNSKYKTKKLFAYGTLVFQLSQPLVPYAAAVIIPLPPAMSRLSPIEQDRILSNNNFSPKIATISELKIDKIRLTNEQIQQFNNLAIQLNTGSITMEEALLQLRGGSGVTDVAAILAFVVFVNWYDSLFGVEAFGVNPLPHQDPFGWFNGKYNSKQSNFTSRPRSRFELEMNGINQDMCLGLDMADEDGFVMTYAEALNLVNETYPGYLQVNESCKITDWQAAKHVYHGMRLGMKPEDYGFTQKELERIRGEKGYKEGGLVAYARRGYQLPPIEMVRDYQSRLKEKCEQPTFKKTNVDFYDVNGASKATVFGIRERKGSGIIIAFNELTGDLITGDKQRKSQFDKIENENYLGSKTCMLKWRDK